MIVYKCKMCNGNLDMSEWKRLVKCGYCDTFQSVPSLIDENKAEMVNRANRFRQSGDFDKAKAIFEQILEDDDQDPEIYWSVVLCKFGVEYVEDPVTKEIKPTINRTQSHSILQDPEFKNAIAHADAEAKSYYMAEAEKIEKIQESIWRIAQDAEDYDVFISYKEKGPDGERSKSALIAQGLYEKLEAAGFKTFYAAVSLQDKIGSEYEPYIYSALTSAEVMLVVGTRKDEFTAPWVKNEWSRFQNLANEQTTKRLIPCFKDLTIEDLPDALEAYQGLDMSKEGFEQGLIENIKKIISTSKTVPGMEVGTTEEKMWQNADTFLFLKNFDKADQLYTELCRRNPNNPRGWWGKVCAITEDFTNYRALVTRYNDLKNWMGFIKKLSTKESYEGIQEKYVVYLNQASKQMAPEEMERVKKIMEDDMQYIKDAQRPMARRKEEAEKKIKELEKLKKTQEHQVRNAKVNVDNAMKRLKNRGILLIFFGIFVLPFGLVALTAVVNRSPSNLFVLATFIMFCFAMAGGALSKKNMQKALAIEQQHYDDAVQTLNDLINKINAIHEREGAMAQKVDTNIRICNDVIQNGNRYLSYGADAISHLLFNMMCHDVGVNQSIDRELFDIRQHVFQKTL